LVNDLNEGQNEVVVHKVVEYNLWLKMLKVYRPLIIDDENTVFIIHKGSTSTGSFLKFSKAVHESIQYSKKRKSLSINWLLC